MRRLGPSPTSNAEKASGIPPTLHLEIRLAFVLLGATLLTNAAVAQVPALERRTFAVSVVDRHGKPIRGLAAGNFRGKFRGRPVTVLSASPDIGPRRIALVIDISGSMGERRTLRLVWASAERLISVLGPQDRVALLTVADYPVRHTGSLSDRAQLRQVLSELQGHRKVGKGRTALLDAIMWAIREFDGPGFADVVYLVSDAQENASRTDIGTVEAELARSGVRLFLLRLPMVRPGGPEEKAAEGWAQRLLAASGGLGLELRPPFGRLEQVYAQLDLFHEHIEHVYRLEAELGEVVKKPAEWKLEVVERNGKRLKDVDAAYPELLLPSSGARPAP